MAVFHINADFFKASAKLLHFLLSDALPNLPVRKFQDLPYLSRLPASFLCEADQEGAAAARVPFPNKEAGLPQPVQGAGHGGHIHMAGISQLLLCYMVLCQEGVEDAGVSLSQGQADLVEIRVEQLLAAYEFDPGYWSNWNGPGQDDWEDEDDWWYDSGGPGAQYGQGWRYSPGGWWFQLYGGSWLSNGWQLIHSRWYLFDQNGCMVTGWYKDKDGSRFYLNPVDDGTLGMMRTGWQVIDGKSYYFNTQSDGFMGKLYVDATTPDGYKVGADGALVQ